MPKDPESDEKLILRYQQQEDKSAFDELAKRYYKSVFNFFHFKGFSDEDAADHTQEVFVRLIYGLLHFRRDCKFTTFLYRIVRNYYIDVLRARPDLPQCSLEAEILGEQAERFTYGDMLEDTSFISPQRRLEQEEFWQIVDKCLQIFSNHKIRSVIALRISGMTLQHASNILSIRYSYVNSMWTKNKLKFWNCVKDHYQEN